MAAPFPELRIRVSGIPVDMYTPNSRSKNLEIRGFNPKPILIFKGQMFLRWKREVPEFLDVGTLIAWILTR